MSGASITQAPVRLRLRPDLVFQLQEDGRRRWWVVKDPVTLRYFQLQDEEATVLRLLDGRRSFDGIRREFERTFAPRRLTAEQLQQYFAQLHSYGLVLAETIGQSGELKARRDRQQRRSRWATAASVLWYRFRGVDPERLLTRGYPRVRWMLSPWFLAACSVCILSAVVLAALKFDALGGRLPSLRDFLDARNVLWLAVVLAAVKVLHELGHAFVCKHYGGECHEIGILLFVGMPLLYCNVSDAWTFPGRWQRISVSAAGMAVELVLAAVATWLWYLSEPGLLNTLCLNLVVVCSIRTLVLNGSPLLRYDGYYILSDLVGVPNLSQRAAALLGVVAARWFAGLRLASENALFLPTRGRGWLAAFAIASAGYRMLIFVSIAWLCYVFLKPYGLQVLAVIVAGLFAARMLFPPVQWMFHLLSNPGLRRRLNRGRLSVSLCLALSTLVFVLVVPLPNRIKAPARLEPAELQRAYVTAPGNLRTAVAAESTVRRGDLLAQLENLDAQMQVAVLEGERNRQQLHLRNLEIRSVDAPELVSRIPAEKEALDDIENRLRERRRELEELRIASPTDGVVFPPPLSRPTKIRGQLPSLVGSPLDPSNRGCYLPAGTLLCLVADPERMEAVLLIEESDVGLVKPGQSVTLSLDQTPGNVIGGVVREVSRSQVETLSEEFRTGDAVAQKARSVSAEPMETLYEARVDLVAPLPSLLLGTKGHAKITAEPLPVWIRGYRYLKRTFAGAAAG